MNTFPIYNLVLCSQTHDITVPCKTKLISDLKKIPIDVHVTIFAIIRRYQLLNIQPNDKLFSLPYLSEQDIIESNIIKFDLDRLPNTLKHMLVKFCEIHFKNIE